MIPQEKVEALVEAHAHLDKDPATAVVWFRKDESMVWLLEVIPTFDELADEDQTEEPTFFNAGITFRFPLALIAGTRRTLEATLRSDPKLAKDLATGKVLLDGGGDGTRLVELAKQVA